MTLLRLFIGLAVSAILFAGQAPAQTGAQSGAQTAPVTLDPDKKTVFMILWRGETEVEQGFKAYMAERGVDLNLIIRSVDRDKSKLPGFIAEAKALRPDVVYTWGTSITMGTVGQYDAVDPDIHITDIPVVFTLVSYPRPTKIAPPPDGPRRPNVTGTSHIAPLSAQINAMRAMRPMRRLGIIYNPQEDNSRTNVADLKRNASELDYTVLEAPVPLGADGAPDPLAIPGLVQQLADQNADVIYIGPDNFVGEHRQSLTDHSTANGIPTFSATQFEIRNGDAMFGLISRYDLVGRLVASKVLQVLDGTPPSEIPIETLDRFTYLIKLPVALKLKIYPPLSLLDYAEVVD
ncbi:MAG: ABC transporter substrate-binding protein [Rhodospirillaceae bacterium]